MKSGLFLNSLDKDTPFPLSDDESLLLFGPRGVVRPFFVGAFSTFEGWPWTLKSKYLKSILVDRNGKCYEVKEVFAVGLFGRSFGSKVFSILNSNWKSRVIVCNVVCEFDYLKRAVIGDILSGEFWVPLLGVNASEVCKIVDNSRNCEELFRSLKLGREFGEDSTSLDVL